MGHAGGARAGYRRTLEALQVLNPDKKKSTTLVKKKKKFRILPCLGPAPSDHNDHSACCQLLGANETLQGWRRMGQVCESHTEQEKPDMYKQLRFSAALKEYHRDINTDKCAYRSIYL